MKLITTLSLLDDEKLQGMEFGLPRLIRPSLARAQEYHYAPYSDLVEKAKQDYLGALRALMPVAFPNDTHSMSERQLDALVRSYHEWTHYGIDPATGKQLSKSDYATSLSTGGFQLPTGVNIHSRTLGKIIDNIEPREITPYLEVQIIPKLIQGYLNKPHLIESTPRISDKQLFELLSMKLARSDNGVPAYVEKLKDLVYALHEIFSSCAELKKQKLNLTGGYRLILSQFFSPANSNIYVLQLLNAGLFIDELNEVCAKNLTDQQITAHLTAKEEGRLLQFAEMTVIEE